MALKRTIHFRNNRLKNRQIHASSLNPYYTFAERFSSTFSDKAQSQFLRKIRLWYRTFRQWILTNYYKWLSQIPKFLLRSATIPGAGTWSSTRRSTRPIQGERLNLVPEERRWGALTVGPSLRRNGIGGLRGRILSRNTVRTRLIRWLSRSYRGQRDPCYVFASRWSIKVSRDHRRDGHHFVFQAGGQQASFRLPIQCPRATGSATQMIPAGQGPNMKTRNRWIVRKICKCASKKRPAPLAEEVDSTGLTHSDKVTPDTAGQLLAI